MEFEDIRAIVGEIPVMTPTEGRIIYDYIRRLQPDQCLELGFHHGTSSCYIAAALSENEFGHLTTMDVCSALERRPNVNELLDATGLSRFVTPVFADRSYTWELMKLIERQSSGGRCEPLFDFCYIDGAHAWETDGMAFFLVEKLLRPGGWILFDDLPWTFATSPTLKDQEWVKKLPEDERCTPQIGRVFNLLVRQHSSFSEVFTTEDWGWARKAIIDERQSVSGTRVFLRWSRFRSMWQQRISHWSKTQT